MVPNMETYLQTGLSYGYAEGEMLLRYMGAPTGITGVLKRGRQEGQRETRGCYTVAFEDGGRGHGPRNAGGSQELEKARKQTLPRASGRTAALRAP